jgi:hypothetical protein
MIRGRLIEKSIGDTKLHGIRNGRRRKQLEGRSGLNESSLPEPDLKAS